MTDPEPVYLYTFGYRRRIKNMKNPKNDFYHYYVNSLRVPKKMVDLVELAQDLITNRDHNFIMKDLIFY